MLLWLPLMLYNVDDHLSSHSFLISLEMKAKNASCNDTEEDKNMTLLY